MNRQPLVATPPASLLLSLALVVAVGLGLGVTGCASTKTTTRTATPAASSSNVRELKGLFRIDPGACSTAGPVRGSTFRMVQPNGTVTAGPYVTNSDSTCKDKTWTALAPGSDSGLVTGGYQPATGAAFDAGGNGTASRITTPTKFFAVSFSLATNATDPQTNKPTVVPTIRLSGTTLSGDLRALAAAWNGQQFNQGSPKPDGSTPGATTAVHGTYDPATHHYTLDWASLIVGGPFNNFTGVWHLEGTFQARSA